MAAPIPTEGTLTLRPAANKWGNRSVKGVDMAEEKKPLEKAKNHTFTPTFLCPVCHRVLRGQGFTSHLKSHQERNKPTLSKQEATMTDCPTCKANEERATTAEQGLAELKEAAEKEKNALTGQIEVLENSVTMPTVDEFIRHCEDGQCGDHAQEWAKAKDRIIAQGREKAEKVNLFLPTKVKVKIT